VTATARKIAALFYNAVRHGMEYVDPGASFYETRYPSCEDRVPIGPNAVIEDNIGASEVCGACWPDGSQRPFKPEPPSAKAVVEKMKASVPSILDRIWSCAVPSLFKPQISTDQLAPPGGTRPVHQCDVEFPAERAAEGQGDGVALWI
jgi:hypothetical protein